MKNKKSLIFLLFTELLCFQITRIYLSSYTNNEIYLSSMNLVQSLYFLPFILTSIYFFTGIRSDKSLIINSSIGLILYTITLHIFIFPIVSIFTDIQGVINFVEYAWKIYSICLPLIGIQMLAIKKEAIKKSCFLLIFKMIMLFLITFIFNKLFALKGVLYAWSLSEMIWFLISEIILFKNNFI